MVMRDALVRRRNGQYQGSERGVLLPSCPASAPVISLATFERRRRNRCAEHTQTPIGAGPPGPWEKLHLSHAYYRRQASASHQNSGYRAGGRTSEVTVTHSEPREEPVTRPSLREYAPVQRERYLAATRAEKGTLLSEVVTVTGLHRKAAIRLLRRPPRAPTARSRAGRPPAYGSAVAQALEVLWQATGGIGPPRLHPFVPQLLDPLARDGELRPGPQGDPLRPAGRSLH